VAGMPFISEMLNASFSLPPFSIPGRALLLALGWRGTEEELPHLLPGTLLTVSEINSLYCYYLLYVAFSCAYLPRSPSSPFRG
jgi:hypothetical protein